MVEFGGEAAIVPDALIWQLRKRIDAIDAAGGLVFDQLESGDTVRIKSGPFAGYEAIFDMRLPGKERVQVLLAFLSNHPHKVQLSSADIEKI
jgi:transcriptional antiterminator RfaH